MNIAKEKEVSNLNILQTKDTNKPDIKAILSPYRFIKSKYESEKYTTKRYSIEEIKGPGNTQDASRIDGKARRRSSLPPFKLNVNRSVKEGESSSWFKRQGLRGLKGDNLRDKEPKVGDRIVADNMEPMIETGIKEAMPITGRFLQGSLVNDNGPMVERWNGPRHKTYAPPNPVYKEISNDTTNGRRSKKSYTYASQGYLAFGKDKFEKNGYKVKVITAVADDEVRASPMKQYKISFELENNGDTRWPDNVRLVCIHGIYEGNEKMLPCLEPGRSILTGISLLAPKKVGKYLTQWKIFYGRGNKLGSFGESIFKHIQILEQVPVEEKCGAGSLEQEEHKERSPERGITSQIRIEKNKPFRSDKITCAKFLDQVFPGNLKEKMAFMEKFEQDLTVAEAVEKYLLIQGKVDN